MVSLFPRLTIAHLKAESRAFSRELSASHIKELYGVTDGKAVGTYVEHALRAYLSNRFEFASGNTASGIDFPELNVDLKVTSSRQPQSSCPYESAEQKVYGLGYHLLVLIYDQDLRKITPDREGQGASSPLPV